MKNRVLGFVLVSSVLTSLLFSYSVYVREPWFYHLPYRGSQLGFMLSLIKNWWMDGPLNLGLGQYRNPSSVEFPDLGSRILYISYPPGVLIPPYFISLILDREPTADMIMAYNLSNHFLIALILTLVSFFVLDYLKLPFFHSTVLSLIPGYVVLFSPGTLFFFQNHYYTDEAIMLPFALYILLEVSRDIGFPLFERKKSDILQAALMFYGVFTDWLFPFIVLGVYLKRVMNRRLEEKNPLNPHYFLKFFLPAFLAFSLFFLQVYSLNAWDWVSERYDYRTTSVDDFLDVWLKDHYVTSYGPYGPALLFFITLTLAVSGLHVLSNWLRDVETSHDIKLLFNLHFITLFPCIVLTLFASNHAYVHDYTVLKFAIPTSLLGFAISPILFFKIVRLYLPKALVSKKRGRKKPKRVPKYLVAAAVISCIFYSSSALSYGFGKFFLSTPAVKESELGDVYVEQILPELIRSNTHYNDVVFSPHYQITWMPPHRLSHSMKRVYLLKSIKDIDRKVKDIQKPFAVIILVAKSTPVSPAVADILKYANQKIELETHTFYRLTPLFFRRAQAALSEHPYPEAKPALKGTSLAYHSLQTANALISEGDYQLASCYLNETVDILESEGKLHLYPKILRAQAEVFEKLGEKEKSEQVLEKCFELEEDKYWQEENYQRYMHSRN